MSQALWAPPGVGEHIWFLSSLVTIKVPGEAVGGRCTIVEVLMPQGASPPRHTHPADEAFTLLDGTLVFVSGEERFVCETGASWVVPRGVEHTFRVETETARLVATYAPAGMEQCFRAAGVPAEARSLPPPDAPTRRMEEIESAMRAHGHHNCGPPLGPTD